MSIQLKVAIVISCIVIGLTASQAGISIALTKHSLTEAAHNDLTAVAVIAGDLISTKIALLQADAEAVAMKVAAAQPDKLPEIFQEAQTREPTFLAFTILNRQSVVAAWGEPTTPASRLGTSEYLRKAFAGKPSITTSRQDTQTGQLFIFLCEPIDNNRVLSVTINGLLFHELLNSFAPWHTGQFLLLDEYGTIIASPVVEHVMGRRNIHEGDSDPETAKWYAALAESLHARTGSTDYSSPGKDSIFAWQTLASTTEGWVVVFAPRLDQQVAEGQRVLLLAAALFLGAGCIAAFVFSGYAARPFIRIKEQNQKLKDLNVAVVAANEAKSQFLAQISHEMRTPLNAIIGMTELTLNTIDAEDNPEPVENLEKIFSAGTTLLGIINDILDLSKITSGKFEIVPSDYELPSLINDSVTQNMIHLGDKPVTLELKVDPDIPSRLFGDELRVKQIFNNLISNACKYTRVGTVSLHFTFEQGADTDIWLLFVVKDSGIGIRPENITKVFSKYAQMDTAANHAIEGTGLGLPIAKQLAELMGGTITVQSEYGCGSTFTVRVLQKRVSDEPLGEEISKSLSELRFNAIRLQRHSKLVRVQLPYARVLVVDDVPTNLDVAKGLLKPYGMRIDCAASGQAAVNLIREGLAQYNAIFMDHMMPGMDGVEAVRIIRNEIDSDYARTVPIIALTANAVVGADKMFLQNGFQDFLSKPIDTRQFDKVIRQWVRDKELEKQNLVQGDSAGNETLSSSQSEQWRVDRRQRQRREDDIAVHEMKPAIVWNIGEIDGLHIAKGMVRCGGDMESYFRIVGSYVRHTPPLLEKVRAVTQETLTDYRVTVHGLKGSSRTIGADAVGAMAETLEKAADVGDFVFIRANNQPFLEATEKLLAALSAALQGQATPKPVKDEPDAEALEALRQACENFDIDQMNQTMQTLAEYTYCPGPGADLMTWLEEKTFCLDFQGIAKRLETAGNAL